jgi:hypothetical protein
MSERVSILEMLLWSRPIAAVMSYWASSAALRMVARFIANAWFIASRHSTRLRRHQHRDQEGGTAGPKMNAFAEHWVKRSALSAL